MTKPQRDPAGSSLPRPRSVQRQEERRQRAHDAPARMARSFVKLPQRLNPVGLVAAAVLLIFLAVSIATPLRNYFEQRSELAHINETIAAQQERKKDLTEELNRYQNEDYIKEQARVRLGLIEPGESAYRIVSPGIQAGTPGENPGEEDPKKDQRWYSKLWNSISVPEDQAVDDMTPDGVENHHLPTVPGTEPSPAPAPAPAPSAAPGQ